MAQPALTRLQFANLVDADELMRHVQLAARGNRLSGDPDEAAALDDVARHLEGWGYRVRRFDAQTLIGLPRSAHIDVLSPSAFTLPAFAYSMAPTTGPDGVIGQLVDVGGGAPGDYPAAGIPGAIALSRGLAMPPKTPVLDASGAAARIDVHDERFHEMCVSTVWGSPTPADVPNLPRTPALGVTAAEGERLYQLLADGPVTVRVVAETLREWRPIPILIAELAELDGAPFVLFSGHVDSWHTGGMDNASGTAVQLTIARLLAQHRDQLRRGVRFAFWSGHSHGRYAGSSWYAEHYWQDLWDQCVCHMNVDSVGGVGADVLEDAPVMAETFQLAAEVMLEQTGVELRYRRMPRAGDQSFWGIGVPSLFATLSEQSTSGAAVEAAANLLTGASPRRGRGFGWWFHTREDTVEKVDPSNLRRDASIYAAVTWELCTCAALPFESAAAARELSADLEQIQRDSGEQLDLSDLTRRAGELAGAIAQFEATCSAAEVLNELHMAISRALVPVSYTATGPFDQDPAVSVPALPGLAPAAELPSLADDAPARQALLVTLQRQRNRVGAAISEAERALSHARRAVPETVAAHS